MSVTQEAPTVVGKDSTRTSAPVLGGIDRAGYRHRHLARSRGLRARRSCRCPSAARRPGRVAATGLVGDSAGGPQPGHQVVGEVPRPAQVAAQVVPARSLAGARADLRHVGCGGPAGAVEVAEQRRLGLPECPAVWAASDAISPVNAPLVGTWPRRTRRAKACTSRSGGLPVTWTCAASSSTAAGVTSRPVRASHCAASSRCSSVVRLRRRTGPVTARP